MPTLRNIDINVTVIDKNMTPVNNSKVKRPQYPLNVLLSNGVLSKVKIKIFNARWSEIAKSYFIFSGKYNFAVSTCPS